MNLGGDRLQAIAQHALTLFQSEIRDRRANDDAVARLGRLFASQQFTDLVKLSEDIDEEVVHARDAGLPDFDDLVLSVINKRKA